MGCDDIGYVGVAACFLIVWGLGIANSAYVIGNQTKLREGRYATIDFSYFS